MRRGRGRGSAASGPAAAESPPPEVPQRVGLEEQFLLYVVAAPRLLGQVERFLADELRIRPLDEGDFRQTENRQVFAALRAGPTGEIATWQERLEADLRRQAERLQAAGQRGPALPEELMEQDAVDCALRLMRRNLQTLVGEMRYLLEDPAALPAEQLAALGRQVEQRRTLLRQIDQTLKARSRTGKRQAIEADGQPYSA